MTNYPNVCIKCGYGTYYPQICLDCQDEIYYEKLRKSKSQNFTKVSRNE